MQRLFGLSGEIAVNGNEVARPRGLARNNDLVLLKPGFDGQFGGLQRGEHHAIVDNLFGFLAEILVRVLLHLAHHQLLIQRAAIHADSNGLAVVARDLADGGELFISPLPRPHIAGVDPVFIQRFRAFRRLGQKYVPVVMKVADDGSVAPGIAHPFFDLRNRRCRFRHVHCPTHNLRPGFGQLQSLLQRRPDVGGVRVGHGLHDDGRASADAHVSDLHAVSFAARMAASSSVKTLDLCKHSPQF